MTTYLLIKTQQYSENTPEYGYGYGDCPAQIDYIAAVVEGETLRKAQAAVRKLFPGTRFGGMFSPLLIDATDKDAKLYTKPADIRLSRSAVHAHREALETLGVRMNAKQFTAALERLELSHRGAEKVLGIGRNTVIRYAHGRTEVPESVRRLIVLLEKHGIPKEFA